MSKRDEGFLVEDYRRRNFLAEAVRNYLCLLGWSPKDDREFIPIDELVSLFGFSGINRDGARFDERKLTHMNMVYLRRMPIDDFHEMARPMLESAGLLGGEVDGSYLRRVLELCQEKIRILDELPAYVGYFFREDFPIDAKARSKLLARGEPLTRLRELLGELGDMRELDEAEVEGAVERLSEENGVYTGEYIHPVRLAVSGTRAGPSIYALLCVLGKERTLSRSRRFLGSCREIP